MQLPTQDTPNALISNCSTGTVSFSDDSRVPSTDRHEGNLGRESSERIECVARTIPRNVRGDRRIRKEKVGNLRNDGCERERKYRMEEIRQIESWHSSRYEDGT